MIPADRFTSDGDIALLVQENGAVGYHAIAELWSELNRPCDNCDGDGAISPTVFVSQLCPDCDGTGRHTFVLET